MAECKFGLLGNYLLYDTAKKSSSLQRKQWRNIYVCVCMCVRMCLLKALIERHRERDIPLVNSFLAKVIKICKLINRKLLIHFVSLVAYFVPEVVDSCKYSSMYYIYIYIYILGKIILQDY